MDRKHLVALAVVLTGTAGISSALSGAITAPTRRPVVSASPSGNFSVLTYNVKGLPFPAASNRSLDLAEIGASLASMREDGTAPQVVVLQEAFTVEARDIARRSGYRYVAFGPGADTPRPNERSIVAPDDFWKGETIGPVVSSGLVIMSDYKLSDIRMEPFPAGACSGYDCLANKGVLSAYVTVPGARQPVQIITTHLNSAKPSGQPEAISRPAYDEQVRALSDFMAKDSRPESPRIFAGDFNVGHSSGRLEILTRYLQSSQLHIATAQGKAKYQDLCVKAEQLCAGQMVLPSNVPLVHASDLQLYAAPGREQLEPVARAALFGSNGRSGPLSDHLGLEITYRLR